MKKPCKIEFSEIKNENDLKLKMGELTDVEFFISITGFTNQSYNIDAISVKMGINRLTYETFLNLLESVQGQLVYDINWGEVGSPAYNNVALKVQELAAILPNADVTMDTNFEYYGVDVNYENLGIPIPIEEPILIINVVHAVGGVYKYDTILSNDFKTLLCDLLVYDANG